MTQEHARVALYCYDWVSHKTEVECRCGWKKQTGSRHRAMELYREHKAQFEPPPEAAQEEK